MNELTLWDLWIPAVASQGISFARGRCDATDIMLVHSAPSQLSVDVWTDQGALLARGKDLMRTDETPIAKLQVQGRQITRQDIWPTDAEYNLPVILPGGEIGLLRSWWNDSAHQEWRWNVELYNHR